MRRVMKGGRTGLVAAITAVVLVCTGSAVAVTKITGAQVADGSLQAKDLSKKARKSLKGKRGARGPAGPQGLPGAPGAPGAAGKNGADGKSAFDKITLTEAFGEAPLDDEVRVVATCPEGMIPVSGGFDYFTVQLDGQAEPVPGTAFSDPDMVVNFSGMADEVPPSSDPNVPPGDGVADSWAVIVYNGGQNNAPGYVDLAFAIAHCAPGTTEFAPPPTTKAAQRAAALRAARR